MGLANGAVATGPLTVSCIDSEEWFRAVCGAVKSARGRRGHRGHSWHAYPVKEEPKGKLKAKIPGGRNRGFIEIRARDRNR